MDSKKEGVSQSKSAKAPQQKQNVPKKKLVRCAIPCLCWAAKVWSAGLEQMPETQHTNKMMEEIAFNQFLQQRDECEACQPETPRTKDKCSCKDAYEYLMSLFPPITRQVFPTQLQISCAELDWTYERKRCLFCKERASKQKIEEDLAGIMMKKKELGHMGWTMFSCVPLKITLKEVEADEENE